MVNESADCQSSCVSRTEGWTGGGSGSSLGKMVDSGSGSHRGPSIPENVRKFVAGGIAGTCAKCLVSPLDRIKILRQGEHKVYGDLSLWKSVRSLIKQEGITQLWRGLPALCIRIFPYAGIQFLANDTNRHVWNTYSDVTWARIGPFNVPVKNLACGSMAGVTACLATYPLDLIRTRILYTTIDQTEYSTWLRTCKTIYNQPGGFWNFYQGIRPAIIGMVFYAGINFGTFESFKEIAKEKETFCGHIVKDENGELKWIINFVLGGTTATLSQFIIFPLDSARRRMQNAQLIASQKSLKDSMSVWLTLKDLWKRSPNPFFPTLIYRGFSLNILRAVPMTATSFTLHEKLRSLFNVPRDS